MKFRLCNICFLICYFFLNACSNNLGQQIPIYIEDYHTGSFYRLAEHLDWDEEYGLILFDAHSDAFAVFQSRGLRQELAAARNQGKIKEFLQKINEHNIIQCYNWLEPLMPIPISQVIWIFPRHVDTELETFLRAQVKRELCAGGHAEANASCDLERLFTITDFEKLLSTKSADRACVVSIALDYFANINVEVIEKKLHSVLDFTFALPRLKAVTVAISNIYLKDNTQGHRLLFLLLQYLVENKKMPVFFEPFIMYGEDRSREARAFVEQGRTLPAYDIAQAPEYLKVFICRYQAYMSVNQEPGRWHKLLSDWQREIQSNDNSHFSK